MVANPGRGVGFKDQQGLGGPLMVSDCVAGGLQDLWSSTGLMASYLRRWSPDGF